MGSSSASETTINTSTDSSNTLVTTITMTDGNNTEDSLDITDSLDNLTLENSILSSQMQPLTVPPNMMSTMCHFSSPSKNEKLFNFGLQPLVDKAQDTESINALKGNTSPDKLKILDVKNYIRKANINILMGQQTEAWNLEAKRRNSYKAAQNDPDSIEMVVSKNNQSKDTKEKKSLRSKLVMEGDGNQRMSSKKWTEIPMYSSSENETESPRPKHRHKKSSRRHNSPKNCDKFLYDEHQVAKYRDTADLTTPDLKIGFSTETMDNCQRNGMSNKLHPSEKRGSVCLNKCLREVGTKLDLSVITSSPINVTTNPLDNSVNFEKKATQATIVVQQPSLTLDHGNISTILLKNGSDFVSSVEVNTRFKREENMKQLLDIANNLTLEEIHDFEMRYGSPHHNRSQSVKTPGRTSSRPNYLCLPQQRSRVASMPNTGVEEEYYRLRHFSITGKGIVNRGDSLKSRRSRSNNSVGSSNSSAICDDDDEDTQVGDDSYMSDDSEPE